jgi:PAS domain S-box-containing protein
MVETDREREWVEAGPSAGLRDRELRGLADFVPQLVWMCTPEGANTYFNQRWVEYTGLSLEESHGDRWIKPFHEDDREKAHGAWKHAVQSGQQYQVESRLRSADGTYRWFLIRGQPIHEEDGRVLRWFGTCTDIQDLKQAELLLLRSEKLAAAGRMAATVSHEINNPLESVINLIYLARGTGDIQAVHAYLDEAEGELERIAHITRQTLGFYREQNEPVLTSIQALLESAIDLLKARITAKHVKIETRWCDAPSIYAVAGELRQVFTNLLANSLDAVDMGGRILIRTSIRRNHADGRLYIRISIADNGQGIQSSVRNQLFEPFFTTKERVGTGLGLWVSKQILDKHQGTIQLRSRSQGTTTGTVFRISLPYPSPTGEEPHRG